MKKVLIGLAVLLAMTSVFAFSNKTEFNTWVSTYQGTTPQFVELAKSACLNAQGVNPGSAVVFNSSKSYWTGLTSTGCNLKTPNYVWVCPIAGVKPANCSVPLVQVKSGVKTITMWSVQGTNPALPAFNYSTAYFWTPSMYGQPIITFPLP